MSAFTFDFDLEDDLDKSFNAIPPQEAAAVPSIDTVLAPEHEHGAEIPADEIPFSALLSALPEALSYSPLKLPGPSSRTLARRDLFDARFQLLAQDERDERTAVFVDAPADLVPGAYEGGLKTWECALDLAVYLDRDILGSHAGAGAARCIRGLRVLELGCGTAVPTLLLLDHLFAQLASETPGAADSSCGGDSDAGSELTPMPSVQETDIHLQDYNRSVLELVTFPNVLLAWYTSPLSAEYRASAAADSDDEENGEETTQGSATHAVRAYRRGPGGLTVTPAMLDAFKASLEAHKVRLRFFTGGWSTLRECLIYQGGHQPPPSYDIVLASETIYRTEALGAFVGVLRAATAADTPATTAAPPCDREEVRRPLCLVAAKVLYFGVGGGIQAFVTAVEGEHGTAHTMWEHREGVGRVIMCIEW